MFVADCCAENDLEADRVFVSRRITTLYAFWPVYVVYVTVKKTLVLAVSVVARPMAKMHL